MKQFAVIMILALSFTLVNAQTATRTRDTTSIPSMLRFGIQYRSDYYYMGRADSAAAPYLTPSVTYFHKSGLFLSGNLSYLTVPEQNRIDMYSLSGGYDYYRNNFAAGISVSQYFFNDSSYAVQAEMSTYASAYAGYDFNWFMVIVDGSLGVSSERDIFLGAEISRSFYLFRDRLRLTPSLYTNFGTQNYYRDYYTYRSITTGGDGGKGDGKGKGDGDGDGDGSGDGGGGDGGNGGGGNGGGGSGGGIAMSATTPPTTTIITEATTLNSEKFQLLDYELSLQASYRVKNFQFVGTTTVLFPVNPSTVVTDQGTYTEELNTGFQWSLGIRYTIK